MNTPSPRTVSRQLGLDRPPAPVVDITLMRVLHWLDRDIALAVRRSEIIPECLDEPLEPLAQLSADGYARHRLGYPPLHKPIPFRPRGSAA